jgi:hypothetical protein
MGGLPGRDVCRSVSVPVHWTLTRNVVKRSLFLIFFVFIVGAMVFAAVPIAFAFGLATVGYI